MRVVTTHLLFSIYRERERERGAGEMESYGERRVTVYDVIFGELRFLDSHTT